MSSHSFGLIEVLLIEALVIGWAVRQWWSVRPSTRQRPEEPQPQDTPQAERPAGSPTEPPAA